MKAGKGPRATRTAGALVPWRRRPPQESLGPRGRGRGVEAAARASGWLALLALGLACGPAAEPHPPSNTASGAVFSAGHVYMLTFPTEVDLLPFGTTWTGTTAADGPLAFMRRTPVILKVDDLGGPFNAPTARFVELADEYGAVTSLGIITSQLTDDDEVNATYRALHAAGSELWFHGRTFEEQRASFEAGLALGLRVLGVEFRAFGAPGNEIDGATGSAMAEFPQLAVWLFGDPRAEAVVDGRIALLPRHMDIEVDVGELREASEVLAELEGLGAVAALTLQVHPIPFDDEDLDRARAIFRGIEAQGRFRYTSPSAWRAWTQDRARVTLTKGAATTYTLDLTAASHDQRITFDPAGPPPEVTLLW